MTKARFFNGSSPKLKEDRPSVPDLPADVNHVIANKLNALDLANLRVVNKAGRAFVTEYRKAKSNLIELAGTPRKEFQKYLRHYFPADSDNLKDLQRVANQADSSAHDYALYALVARVIDLDKAKLQTAINVLSEDSRLTQIVTTLNIIDCYLTQQSAEERAQALRYLFEKANGAYINLSGANLSGDFSGLDFSYADFNHATLLFNAAGSQFTGADLRNVTFGGATNLDDVDPEGVLITGASTGDKIIEWDEDPVSGFLTLDAAPLFRSVINQAHERKLDEQEQFNNLGLGGCNIL